MPKKRRIEHQPRRKQEGATLLILRLYVSFARKILRVLDKLNCEKISPKSQHKSKTLIESAEKGYLVYQEAANHLLDARLDQEIPKYHHKCFLQCNRYRTGVLPGKPKGRPNDSAITSEIEEIYKHIEKSNDVVYKMSELTDMLDGSMDNRTVIKRLQSYYGKTARIITHNGVGTFLVFEEHEYDILKQEWTANNLDPAQEAMKNVQSAATVIRHQICKNKYETEYYPSGEVMFSEEKMVEDIPELLFLLIQSIISTNKTGKPDALLRKFIVICHLIIAATRPRSFMSSVLVGLGVMIYQKFASKNL
ncbi:unnamed protein product [Psylliodes chrysocephalus]|uniref:Uncharacterized protein n=1 Tax=Psylliodes chrysocephalus TaxID=3402493 RepID=A0A9P0GC49_9CUCU|nr:unnamed protein product [Psylliodes chrysocephala]